MRTYCSPNCYPSELPRPIKQSGTCAFCGNSFVRTTNSTRRYCSERCRLNSLSTRRHGLYGNEALARTASVGTQKPCAMCDRLFTIKLTAMTQMYCSTKCNSLAARLRMYGLNVATYRSMITAQRGRCKMCGIVPRKGLHIDHDHKTMKVRGLLCVTCNVHLGWYELNKRKVEEYLS